jgi:hypothetical protein
LRVGGDEREDVWDPTNRTLIAANVFGKWLEVVPRSTVVRRWSPD